MIVINHHHYYFLLSWFYSYRLISEVGICGYEMRHEARDCFCSLESSWVRKPIRRTSTPDVSDLFEHHSTQWGTSCAARLDELHIAGEVKYSNFVSNSTYPLFILICCKLHVPFIWILAALRFFQHLAGGWPHDLPFGGASWRGSRPVVFRGTAAGRDVAPGDGATHRAGMEPRHARGAGAIRIDGWVISVTRHTKWALKKVTVGRLTSSNIIYAT